jgi:hypothetical protein
MMPKPPVIKYQGDREVRTYSELHHAVNVLIDTARDHVRGTAYTAMSALVLEALMFEAYLNHLGEGRLNLWKPTDSISWWKKFKLIREKIGLEEIDVSLRPYSTVRELFKFRDQVAHGRTETISEEFEVEEIPLAWPQSEWENGLTLDHAVIGRDHVDAIICTIHSKAGLGDYPFDPPGALGKFGLK